MRALVIGATGSTGGFLVEKLLADKDYTLVRIFVRKSTGKQHPKLEEQIIDFSVIENYKHLIIGDVFFSCLGTTLKAAGSKENQKKIDLGIPTLFARLSKENGVSSFVLLSAYGASSKSNVFYSQIKGKLEDTIEALNFQQYIIFKPGLLLRQDSDRFGEKIIGYFLKIFNSAGLFKKFKPLATDELAEKLAIAPKVIPNGIHLIELDKIWELG